MLGAKETHDQNGRRPCRDRRVEVLLTKMSAVLFPLKAGASHAWLSVYCGQLCWIDVDPTNNVFPTTEHITLDYGDVCPIQGVCIGRSEHAIEVAVDVIPLLSSY